MRILPLALLASLALLLLPATASASETWGCHSYELYVGDQQTGAGVSTDEGAAAAAVAGELYVVNDGLPLLNPWIFSIWVYTETNGEPGLQRGDEVCDDGHGGYPDCFLSCTF